MQKEVYRLFATVDKLFGGDGSYQGVLKSIKAFEREHLFTRRTLWHVPKCIKDNRKLSDRRNRDISFACGYLQPNDLCRACKLIRAVSEDDTPDFVYVYDMNKQSNVFATNEVVETLGYSNRELRRMGENLLEAVIHPDDIPIFEEYRSNLSPHNNLKITYRAKDPEGEWRYFQGIEVPFKIDIIGNKHQGFKF